MGVGRITGDYAPILLSKSMPLQADSADSVDNRFIEKKREDDAVKLSLSTNAKDFMGRAGDEGLPVTDIENELQSDEDESRQNSASSGEKSLDGDELTDGEKAMVEELKERDLEVRTHESQHLAAAGSYAVGGASFEYQTGPDGNAYAVGGSVDLDISEVKGNPQATINKARALRMSAMATSEPSSSDLAVAAGASSMEAKAAEELQEEQRQKIENAYDSASFAYNSTGILVNVVA